MSGQPSAYKGSFRQDPETHHRLRPPVPCDVVNWMLPQPCNVAIDVGAGAGLLTRDLITRAAKVVALDPNPRMRKFLRCRYPNVNVAPGEAEWMAKVADRAADAVCVSTAWHWLQAPAAEREFARVLRDGGRLSVVWTHRDKGVAWVKEVSRCTDFLGQRDSATFDLPNTGSFEPVERMSMRWRRSMRIEDATVLFGTYRSVLIYEPSDVPRMFDQIRMILNKVGSDGYVNVPFRTVAFRTHRRPR